MDAGRKIVDMQSPGCVVDGDFVKSVDTVFISVVLQVSGADLAFV